MNNEERFLLIEELKAKLNNIKGNTIKDKINRDKIRREIKELKNTMTDEEFEEMMESRSEIDTGKCRE